MGSARRIGTSENISTYDSGGGKDYTSVAAWWAAHAGDMASNMSPVLEVYGGPHADIIQLSGGSPTASYFPIVRPAPGQGHNGTRNTGVKFTPTTDTTLLLGIAYSSFQDLLISPSLNSTNVRRIVDLGGANSDAVGLIIFNATNVGGGTFRPFYSEVNGEVKWISCRSEDNSAINTGQFRCASSSGTAHKFYNCGVVGGAGIGFHVTNENQAIAVNSLADGMAGLGFIGTFATGTKNNASSKADAPGENSINFASVVYESPSGKDFHISFIDTAVYGAGFNQSSIYDDDIDRDGPISTWHIGPDSISLVAPTLIVPSSNYTAFIGDTLQLFGLVMVSEGSDALATIRVECTAGLLLDVENLSGCTVSGGARESSDLTISGDTVQLQDAISTLKATATSNGRKTITTTLTDNKSQEVSAEFDVVVGPTSLSITGPHSAVRAQVAAIYASLNEGNPSGTITFTVTDSGDRNASDILTLTGAILSEHVVGIEWNVERSVMPTIPWAVDIGVIAAPRLAHLEWRYLVESLPAFAPLEWGILVPVSPVMLPMEWQVAALRQYDSQVEHAGLHVSIRGCAHEWIMNLGVERVVPAAWLTAAFSQHTAFVDYWGPVTVSRLVSMESRGQIASIDQARTVGHEWVLAVSRESGVIPHWHGISVSLQASPVLESSRGMLRLHVLPMEWVVSVENAKSASSESLQSPIASLVLPHEALGLVRAPREVMDEARRWLASPHAVTGEWTIAHQAGTVLPVESLRVATVGGLVPYEDWGMHGRFFVIPFEILKQI